LNINAETFFPVAFLFRRPLQTNFPPLWKPLQIELFWLAGKSALSLSGLDFGGLG